ncbi:MAG: methylated-DNA--[protein]-cysteine S-methyltransferase, partial [Bacteroidales bacterium]|nr:methylated-DNA--[protein]-cysteine S-methyltransferase [Candidatus Sodaliphilus aphodohippi]
LFISYNEYIKNRIDILVFLFSMLLDSACFLVILHNTIIMEVNNNIIKTYIERPIFRLVGEVADTLNRECYIVGGFVRDIFLNRTSNDMDFVTVGSGIEVAKAVHKRIGSSNSTLAVFKTYGTAQVKTRSGNELEFVGARKESYRHESRNPIVEDGTLHDDQLRRDFTINAMAISLNNDSYGKLLDPFDGIGDLDRRIIRTPLDPDVTFSDDPLRMMRAIRFATQLDFDIYPETMQAIARNAKRIKIITRERIADELMKIVRSDSPSRGFDLLDESGLLQLIFPELQALKGVDNSHGRSHKDNFRHTMQVLDNVASNSDNEWLRWAAVMHDIGKPATKRWDDNLGWTFHNHNYIGEKMVPKIFGRMRLPLNEHMKYVKKLVGLHMRPIALVEDGVTDAAVRRLLFDAGDDIDDLMLLCKADITSKNQEKVKRFRDNFDLVKQKLVDIEEKDRVRNFQPPVDGSEIMSTFNLLPSRPVGLIKDAIKDAILDGEIANSYAAAYPFMLERARQLGIEPITMGKLAYTSIESPIGSITIAATTKGITYVGIGEGKENLAQISKARHLDLVNISTNVIDNCIVQINQYFAKERQQFDLPIEIEGTIFSKTVYDKLVQIRYGETLSYSQIAAQIKRPTAYRAVAQACHSNPLMILLPCHRVIASNGSLGGYRAGIGIKKFLLDLEK